MGGIDAVLDILIEVISAVLFVFSLSSTMTYIVTVLIAIPIQLLQSANHALVYNCDIWEKMIGCIRMRKKHSKVIMLRST